MVPIWLDAWPAGPPGASITREAVANWRIAPVVRPLKEDVVGSLVASTLWVLMGAIGAVLLIACANIANLMLVRTDARRPEFAVRAALGAAPARIARELLVESLLLGAAGGVLGLVLAYGGLELLLAIGPSNLPRLQEIAVYPPVLAFTVAVSLASTLVFGSITALKHAVHIDYAHARRGARVERRPRAQQDAQRIRRRAGGARARAGRQRGADDSNVSGVARRRPGLFGPGDDSNGAGLDSGEPCPSDPEQYTALQHEILDRIAALPGVASVGFASHLPMAGVRAPKAVPSKSTANRTATDAPPGAG